MCSIIFHRHQKKLQQKSATAPQSIFLNQINDIDQTVRDLRIDVDFIKITSSDTLKKTRELSKEIEKLTAAFESKCISCSEILNVDLIQILRSNVITVSKKRTIEHSTVQHTFMN